MSNNIEEFFNKFIKNGSPTSANNSAKTSNQEQKIDNYFESTQAAAKDKKEPTEADLENAAELNEEVEAQSEAQQADKSEKADKQSSIFKKLDSNESANKASYTFEMVDGDYSANIKKPSSQEGTIKADSSNQMADFVEEYYNQYKDNDVSSLTEKERYAVEKALIDENRETVIDDNGTTVMDAINKTYLTSQVLNDLEEISEDDTLTSYDVVGQLLDDSQADIAQVEGYANLSDETKEALKNIQDKLQKNEYDQYPKDVNTEKISQEVIENTVFVDSNADNPKEITFNCPQVSTLGVDTDAKGTYLYTNIGFNFDSSAVEGAKTDDEGKNWLSIDVKDMKEEDAKAAIKDNIAKAYGINSSNLKSMAGSAIMNAISTSEDNNKLFDGVDEQLGFFDEGAATVDDVVDRLYAKAKQASDNNEEFSFNCPDVDISTQGYNFYSAENARARLTSGSGDTTFTQMHVTQDSISAQDNNINNALDILDYVQYGDKSLKQTLQNSILSELSGTKYENLSYNEAVNKAKADEGEDSATYQNLVLIADKFQGDDADSAEALKGAIKEVKDSGVEYGTSKNLKSLAATAVKQEFGNNQVLYNQDKTGAIADKDGKPINYNNAFDVLTLDVKGMLDKASKETGETIDQIKLEDVNYAVHGEKVSQSSPEVINKTVTTTVVEDGTTIVNVETITEKETKTVKEKVKETITDKVTETVVDKHTVTVREGDTTKTVVEDRTKTVVEDRTRTVVQDGSKTVEVHASVTVTDSGKTVTVDDGVVATVTVHDGGDTTVIEHETVHETICHTVTPSGGDSGGHTDEVPTDPSGDNTDIGGGGSPEPSGGSPEPSGGSSDAGGETIENSSNPSGESFDLGD